MLCSQDQRKQSTQMSPDPSPSSNVRSGGETIVEVSSGSFVPCWQKVSQVSNRAARQVYSIHHYCNTNLLILVYVRVHV